MYPVTKPQQCASAASLTNIVDTETVNTSRYSPDLNSVATMNVCRVCLAMSVKMYHMSEHKLSVMYERVIGVEINTEDKLPKMLCWECVARLSSAHSFLEKALKTHWLLVKKLNCSKIVTMSDIGSIDRTQYQLESTLGFKFYKENDYNLYIIEESDKNNEYHDKINYNYCNDIKAEYFELNDIDLNNVEEPIIITEVNITDEKDPIKKECLEANEEQNLELTNKPNEDYIAVVSDENIELKFQYLDSQNHVGIKECISDEEVIDNVSIVSDMFNEENQILGKVKVCEGIKQSEKTQQRNRSEALPRKELGVVLEDIMLNWSKRNIEDLSKKFADNAKSSNDNETIDHSKIRKITSNTDTTNEKHMNSTFKNINVCDPVNFGAITSDRTVIVDSNISITKDAAKPSRKFPICDICNKQFQSKATLMQHIRKHPKMYTCNSCSYKSYDKRNLRVHVNAKHTKTNVYYCTYCSYKTYSHSTLSCHVNAKHTKMNVYSCSYCSYKAYRKATLKIHVNVKHTKTKVFNCSNCSYEAYDKRTLTRHVNAKHTKTKVYDCSLCSFKAYDKIVLTRHVNAIHTKVNVYMCSLCDYKAYDKKTLSRHINAIHTKTNVYNCSLCRYKAYDKCTLTKHINIKHT